MKLHEFMLTPALAGAEFSESSWSTWRIIARLIDGDAALLTDDEREVALRLTGRTVLPKVAPREVFIAAGRRGGKSKFAALVATWRAAAEYELSRGETARAVFVAPDREQAAIGLDYARGMVHDSPLLAAELAKDNRGVLTFRHRTELKVVTASYRTSRGTTLCAVVVDEASSLRADDSALPDVELVRAVRPGLDTLRGLLLVISSPHRKVGILYEAHRKYFGNDSDDRHLFIQAATLDLNPRFDETTVAEALEDDPAAAQSEYLGLFRADLEGFLDDKTVDAAIVQGRQELPHVAGRRYVAFCDPSGGRGDAFTLAIAHHERKTPDRAERLVLDCVRSVAAPFDPDVAVEGFAETLKEYRVLKVRGDRYAGEWVTTTFRRNGITYVESEHTRSEIYLEMLPQFSRGAVELLDNPQLRTQLLLLERRTRAGGRDSVDHPRAAHDDLANAVCGALLAARRPKGIHISDAAMETFGASGNIGMVGFRGPW